MKQPRIRILNEKTINQIAAGEVIENPASVVKELVDNAIDAGASHISVETQGGGRGLIKVIDDGCGMSQDDLILSIERHATSKIAAVEELNTLKTMGFRGEALPSIASVSKMTLHSAALQGEGYILPIEGGRIDKMQPKSRRQGTTIEVRGLFFNVPVRRKFQKSVAWDTGEIHKVLIRFALSHSNLGLSWVNDGKQWMAFTPTDDLTKRIKMLLGEEFLENSIPVEDQAGSLILRGRLSTPIYHRPNRGGQYLFVNQRAVHSPFIANKILEAYGTRLSVHRYPLFVLQFNLPPAWIDVNVHPQKKEIRICDEEKISHFILQAVEKGLERGRQSRQPLNLTPIAHTLSKQCEQSGLTIPGHEEKQILPSSDPEPSDCLCETVAEYTSSARAPALFETKLVILAKIKNYFFVQEREGVRIIDISRATERVIYEELHSSQSQQSIQSLMIPLRLTMTGEKKYRLSECLEDLNQKGISIRFFGGDTFVVDAIPAILELNEIPDLIEAYLEEGKIPRHLDKSIRRKEMSLDLGAALIEKLFKCQNSEFTPSGKRIHYLLEENNLEKLLEGNAKR